MDGPVGRSIEDDGALSMSRESRPGIDSSGSAMNEGIPRLNEIRDRLFNERGVWAVLRSGLTGSYEGGWYPSASSLAHGSLISPSLLRHSSLSAS